MLAVSVHRRREGRLCQVLKIAHVQFCKLPLPSISKCFHLDLDQRNAQDGPNEWLYSPGRSPSSGGHCDLFRSVCPVEKPSHHHLDEGPQPCEMPAAISPQSQLLFGAPDPPDHDGAPSTVLHREHLRWHSLDIPVMLEAIRSHQGLFLFFFSLKRSKLSSNFESPTFKSSLAKSKVFFCFITLPQQRWQMAMLMQLNNPTTFKTMSFLAFAIRRSWLINGKKKFRTDFNF